MFLPPSGVQRSSQEPGPPGVEQASSYENQSGSSDRRSIDFKATKMEDSSIVKKSKMFDLKTGQPLEIPEGDLYGSSRPVSDFEKLNRVGEGTYGVVYRARDIKSGE